MDTKKSIASAKFLGGYNCAQSILYAFRDEFGLDEDTALRLACGLGAGMGRKQEVCGAVTGGVIVLGLRHGRGTNDDHSATERTYSQTRELIDRFVARHGAISCRRLLDGCDLMTEEGQRRAKEEDFLNRICRPCVESVVEILEEMK